MKEERSIAENAFLSDFPINVIVHLKTAITHGYIIANKCINDNDFLKSFVGIRDISRLQNTAVEYSIKDRVERFGIDLNIEEANNSRGSFPHYMFRRGKCIFTTSRTELYDAFPRDAQFRSMNSSVNAQIVMQQKHNEFIIPEEFEAVRQYYGIVTFGGREEVDFIRFGIPNERINRWLYRFNVGKVPIVVETELPRKEFIAESKVTEIKDEFLKRQEVAHGGQE